MGDSDGPLVAHRLIGEPRRNTTHKVKNGLAAVRRGRWVAQPGIGGVRLIGDDLAKFLSGPAPVVTLTQHRLNVRVQSKSFRGLAGPQFGTGPIRIDTRQAS